jgi:hypothetical protein
VIRLGDRSLALANALANALTNARGLASDLDNAEVLVGTLARANALANALANASALNLDRGLNLDRVLNRARDLALTLTSALDLNRAHDLDRVLNRARDLDRARDLALAVVCDLVDLDPTAHWARAVVAGGAWSMPGRVPRGLVALAVRLLPAPQRSRYGAEFRVELVELPCRERLGYSMRVLAGAWELRRALVETVRTPDGAAARRMER